MAHSNVPSDEDRPYRNSSDDELLTACEARKPGANDEFHLRFAPTVRDAAFKALRLTSCEPTKEVVEDLCQEFWSRLLETPGLLCRRKDDSNETLRGLVFKAARLMFVRQLQNRRRRWHDQMTRLHQSPPIEAPKPDDKLARSSTKVSQLLAIADEWVRDIVTRYFGLGVGIAGYGARHLGISMDPSRILIYAVFVMLGVAMLYGVLVMLASVRFWIVQHRELFEIWFLLLQFSNYPDEIYTKRGSPISIGTVFTTVMPLLLAINVPAKYGAMLLSGWVPVAAFLTICATTLVTSRFFFRLALKNYRSVGS